MSSTSSRPSTASPASVVPFGLATRRTIVVHAFLRRGRHPGRAEHRFERDGPGEVRGKAAVHARLGKSVDEPRHIGRAGAGDRADRPQGCSRCSSTARSRAARRIATARRAARPEALRRTSATTPRRMATGRFGQRADDRSGGPELARAASSTSTPARIDTTTVCCVRCGVSRATTSSSCCGLQPRMTSFGDGPASP